MNVFDTPLDGVKLIELTAHGDSRGFFRECFQQPRYAGAGIHGPFLQHDHSRSSRNVLRGLHFQREHAQGKLVSVMRGAVFDVAVDVRRSSATFGQWFGAELSDANHRQMWIPTGFAHGFLVLSEVADMHYLCTDVYHPGAAHSIRWDDPAIGIEWPLRESPLVSDKDARARPLAELTCDQLFP